ncbi:MAG TPA: FAD-linked oxidase C-terminal domain-containing protein [Polyangiaceae bacterium]|jgi:FAD/FMN-containing dehydrogenase/Fe-S oxidoreductase
MSVAQPNLVQLHRKRRARDEPASAVPLRELWARLRQEVSGEVRFDDGSRGLYAQDASNYLHVPLGVVLPKTRADVLATLRACHDYSLPVLARAGGTALAGQTCNEAVVIDVSKYLNRILDFDPAARRARVEPGLICDSLTEKTRPHGLTWGPQPATHDRCCFGGMLGNNCGGMRAQQAGIAVHHVEALDVALYDGTELQLGWLTEAEFAQRASASTREGRIFRALRELRNRYAPLIRERFPRLPRRVSGYNLDQLLPNDEGRVNLARTLVGSEGTCATILDATLGLVDFFPERAVVALGYDNIEDAASHVTQALLFEPLAVEGMDRILYDHVVVKHMRQEKFLSVLPKGDAWLLIELGSHDSKEARTRAEQLIAEVEKSRGKLVEAKLILDGEQQQHLWNVREAGLGATAFVPNEPNTWPGLEDAAVPPERIAEYLPEFRALLNKHGYQASLYGHFGMGCVHCRISFELASHDGIETYRRFMHEAAELICHKYRGSISGEHGDGQSRGELLEIMFGAELVAGFREFKAIWDPDGKMNPGRIVDARPLGADLRLGADYDPWQGPTHFKFPADQGSFANATLRCVGVGKCRRLNGDGDQDTMCPSFMVTREERHSTRGRAHLLWEMLRSAKTPIQNHFRDEHVKEALELCMSCKGCKSDCPVNVDLATYKAEFLAHYYAGRLRPRHAYAFGLIDRWARLASRAPGFVNWLTQSAIFGPLVKFVAGMSQERRIPTFAPETFRSWFEKREARSGKHGKVLLWPDTFNDHFYTETAQAAVEVLEQLEFEVAIPRVELCCGRPLYDYGMLDEAKRYLERILLALELELEAGTPIVVLEPSCASVFRDELPNLMPERAAAKRLTAQTFLLSEFLARHAKDRLPRLARRALVQTHCHHKSAGFEDQKRVFEAIGLDVTNPHSGCCGMAGSFGFEAEKYQVSSACGERVILPKVREARDDTLILADGFSCRTQIEQGTGRLPLHLAQALKLALEQVAPSSRPEAAFAARRSADVARSIKRARSTLLMFALLIAALLFVILGCAR